MEIDYQLLLSMWGYGGYGMMGGLAGWSIFALLTWIALIVFLVLGIAYFWKEIQKPKGRR